MMFPDKRRIPTIIISKMKDGMKKEAEAKPEQDMRDEGPLDVITQDILQAFQEKSVKDLKDGLRAFFMECQLSEDKSDEDKE